MPDLFDELFDLAEALEFEEVAKRASAALKGARGDDEADLQRYLAWARVQMMRYADAVAPARACGDRLLEAKALFHDWKLLEADEALEAWDGPEDEEAEVFWYRGVLAEFRDEDPAEHFARAAELDPELFPEPVRLDDDAVRRVLDGALASMPPPVRQAVDETVIQVRDLPRPHPDVDPLSLGLYIGIDRMQRSVDAAVVEPSRIELYRKNIERGAADPEEAADELRITLLHEVGHHLGYDEDGVAALGLE